MLVIENAFSYAGTENICNFMTEVYGDSNEVSVLSLNGSGETFYPFTKTVRIISLENEKNKFKKTFSIINSHGVDVVFVISMGKLSLFYFLTNILFLKKKLRKHIKFIACEHVSISSFGFFKRLVKIIALKRYDKVICLTESDANYLARRNVKTEVIKNPADHHGFSKINRTYNVLAVGRLSFQKGYDLLIPIWKDFVKKNKNWKLQIAGDGEELENLKEMVSLMNLDESIIFLGRVKDITKYYINSDFLIMTSRYEGLPLALLEAKSWSLPCIAYNCPTGPKEIIVNNVDGLLIKQGDDNAFLHAMNILACDDETFYTYSGNTFHTSKDYSSDMIKSKWLEVVSS